MRAFLTALTLCTAPAFMSLALTGPARAEPFTLLEMQDAQTALEGRILRYPDGATQDFRASGATLYKAGEPSWGKWEIRATGQYCSQWPPGRDWACYDLERSADGTQIRFSEQTGYQVTGTYIETH